MHDFFNTLTYEYCVSVTHTIIEAGLCAVSLPILLLLPPSVLSKKVAPVLQLLRRYPASRASAGRPCAPSPEGCASPGLGRGSRRPSQYPKSVVSQQSSSTFSTHDHPNFVRFRLSPSVHYSHHHLLSLTTRASLASLLRRLTLLHGPDTFRLPLIASCAGLTRTFKAVLTGLGAGYTCWNVDLVRVGFEVGIFLGHGDDYGSRARVDGAGLRSRHFIRPRHFLFPDLNYIVTQYFRISTNSYNSFLQHKTI